MLHKHIARHTKKYVKHITKYLYERDTLFATISVFLFLILLGMIPLNLYVLNPMKTALKDFDFNDMKYSKLVNDDKIKLDTSHIVIVNIGDGDREAIANIVRLVNEYHPKVIGLDALFVGERDSTKDAILRTVFETTPNLVVASYIIPSDTFQIRKDYFDDATPNKGYVNFVTENIGTRRFYSPFEIVDHHKVPSFSSAIIKMYDSTKYNKLVKRHKQVETINYSRRVNKYFVVQPNELVDDGVDTARIRNKIVLLGYISKDANDIEDKLFTPMNEKFAGKALPDMNGIVVHANIISMVLEGRYINKAPKWTAWVIAIIIGWIHMSLFIRYYLDSHIWFHLVAKLAQVFSVIFFAYVGIFIFDKFDLKIEMKYTLYVIALAVDVIYFYEAFVGWLHRKYGFQTIFSHHHHPLEHETHHKSEYTANETHNEHHKHEQTTSEHH
jgi:CHASE2 domain-containing sensor protein